MAGGSIAGALIGKQKAPAQATFTPVDTNKVATETLQNNLTNLPEAQKLSTRVNDFNQSEASRLLESAMPGFTGIQSKLMAQINSDLDNQNNLPQDVQDQIARYSAEKGITRGTAGGFNGFSLVKDFGLNLMDWKNASRTRALNTLSTVYGLTPRVSPMSPMAGLVDVNTALNVATSNNNTKYNVEQGNNNARAAASNYNASLYGNAISSIAGTFGGAMAYNAMNPGTPPASTPPPAPPFYLKR
jgi:hypothetical protein